MSSLQYALMSILTCLSRVTSTLLRVTFLRLLSATQRSLQNCQPTLLHTKTQLPCLRNFSSPHSNLYLSTTAYYYFFFNTNYSYLSQSFFVMKTTILTSFVAIALVAARRSSAVVVRSQVDVPGASHFFVLVTLFA